MQQFNKPSYGIDLTVACRRTDTFNMERRSLLGLGTMIRNLRKSRGMTQEGLAERANLSAKYIGEIERGEKNPTFLILVHIAHAMKMRVKDIFEI